MIRHRPLEYKLAVQAFGTLASAYLRLRFAPLAGTRAWASRPGYGRACRADILTAFHRAASRTPATCLVRALALQHLLARNGMGSELRIGVARSASGLEAHAWLVDGDEVLVGGGREAETYTVLATWADLGNDMLGKLR